VCSPGTVLASRGEYVVVEPCNGINTSVVSSLHYDSVSGLVNIPNDDVLVQRSRSKMDGVRRPSNRVNSGCMENPTTHFHLFGMGIMDDNLTVSITRGNVFAIRRVGKS